MSTEHDLQMIDETLRAHDAVAVTPAGVVVGVGPDVATSLRRAAREDVTVYVRDADPACPQTVWESTNGPALGVPRPECTCGTDPRVVVRPYRLLRRVGGRP